MTVKEHYDNHLANFYSWMLGDFDLAKNNFKEYCFKNNIKPFETSLAIDLGAGNGIQSIALAETGFKTKAVDFNTKLLSELETKIDNYPVEIVKDNIINLNAICNGKPVDLIVCCGDTISHLETYEQLNRLLIDCCINLVSGGKLILSFRDYSIELTNTQRFIPVKSDDKRILTCIVDYFDDNILVTDLLYEKVSDDWKQKISSYYKLRITEKYIIEHTKSIGFSIVDNRNIKGMIYLTLEKL